MCSQIVRSKGLTGRWRRRIVIIGVVVEVSWLVLANVALQLPLTQSVINSIPPDKFQVSGQKAWTSHPARFEGTAQLLIADERAVISYANATSDNIQVGAKGIIAETGNDGVINLK